MTTNQSSNDISGSESHIIVSFDGYEVHGVREYRHRGRKYCEQVADTEATFWSLYGHIPGQGLECIGDFKTRQHAEEVYTRITGSIYMDGK